MNYLVVLFKNKERKKIINKFVTLERAKDFYESKIEENKKIIFGKRVENAGECNFELCLLEKKNNQFDSLFVKDDLGRQVKVELDDPDFKIIKVSDYKVEETIFDVTKNKKITFGEFIKNYILRKSVVLISRLNNKVVVQDDDKVNLLSLKNEDESKRFLECLNDYLLSNSMINCIVVIETSKQQKKYLYDVLSNLGIDKKLLYRRHTTFKPR